MSDPGPMGPLVSYPDPMHTDPQLSTFHTHRLLNLPPPRGRGYSDIFMYTRRTGPFLFFLLFFFVGGGHNFDFQYFFFPKYEYSRGMEKVQNVIIFLGLLKFLIFWGMPDVPDIFGANSRCWVQAYV